MKPVTRFAPIALAAVALVVTAPADAQRWHHHSRGAGWDTIGFTTVGSGRDRDTIDVHGNDRHRQIRVCAVNNSIRLLHLDARFANGGHQAMPVRQYLRAGACTAPQDLRGRSRNLASVSIAYEKIRGILPVVRIQAR